MPHAPIPNPQSPIPNPQSPIPNPQSMSIFALNLPFNQNLDKLMSEYLERKD
ncbi:MAG: hypothetical protein V7L23_07610 [Nostoc sp.]|uniref:hypothetical protein n=1 Tax=Nostoc sp. TaxID=1180 RepID=UPI002FF3068A